MAKTLQVKADIIADTASYVAGVKRATAATDKFGRAAKNTGGKNTFRNIGRSAVAATAGVVGLYGAYSQGKKAVSATKDLAKGTLALQRITNLSTQDASRFVAITKVRGIENNKLAISFTALSKQIVQAQKGGNNAADAFKKLGVSQTAIKKGDTKQVFLDAANGLSKLGAGANRTALAAQLFGKSYKELLPLLLSGSKGIQEQLGLAGRLGAEIGGSGADAFKKLAEAERTAKLAQLGLQIQLGQVLIPTLTKGVAVLSSFLIAIRAASTATKVFGASLILVGGALLAGVSAPVVAVVAGIAALAGAFYLAYQQSAGFKNAITQIGAAAAPIFKNVAAVAKAEFPKVISAAKQMATAIGQVIVALKPIIVPAIKVIGSIIRLMLRSIAPSVKLASMVLRDFAKVITSLIGAARSTASGVSSAFNAIKGAVSRVLGAVRGTVSAFRSVGSDIVNGLASGIRGAAGLAIQAAKDLASSLPSFVKKTLGIDSPSKVFAAIGKNVGDGLVVGMMASLPGVKKAAAKVANAASFGVGDELEVAIAARNAGMAKTKKGKKSTGAALRAAEGRQRVGESKGAINTFLAGIGEKIQAAQLSKIMASVNLARAGRAGREAGVARGGLGSAISRAQAEAADPRVQAKFARETLRLDARIAQARKSGSLEAIDALQGEKDALDARYGPQYLAELRDQLEQLNENEIEASSEAAATKFAAQFSTSMNTAMNTLFKNGSVQGFFAAIGKALTGSGVTPGQLSDISAGVPAAGLQFVKKPKTKPKGKRASGGYLTPGALTLVGETGPELIMGGKVMSSTRTNQMGGQGMNITVNAVGAAADDPLLLARQLGWQLATR